MQYPSIEDVLDIGSRMAQELQEFYEESQRAGNPADSVKLLVTEWEETHASIEAAMGAGGDDSQGELEV